MYKLSELKKIISGCNNQLELQHAENLIFTYATSGFRLAAIAWLRVAILNRKFAIKKLAA